MRSTASSSARRSVAAGGDDDDDDVILLHPSIPILNSATSRASPPRSHFRPSASGTGPHTLRGMAAPSCSNAAFFLLVLISSVSVAAGGLVGVDYGRDGNNLLPPERVVDLLKSNGIAAAAIYDSDARVLRAFKDSGIKVLVALRNELLSNAAQDRNWAGTWVWENVGVYYPATQIETIAVGNEVFHQRPDLSRFLVPAMENIQAAVANLKWADRIKVTTPFAFSAVDKSFPPSQGSFRADLQPVVRQILGFLSRTGSYFMINLYPYITYVDNYPNIRLDYTLGQPNPGVRDPATGRMYYSLLDAQLDATYSAMAALGFGGAATTNSSAAGVAASLQQVKKTVAIKETGFPTKGGRPHRGRLAWRSSSSSSSFGGSASAARKIAMEESGPAAVNASLQQETPASVGNAQTYNNNLVQRILSGKTGTPLHPDADFDVYIFSLFNENLKTGPEIERNFGLFYPDGTRVYDIQFRPPGGGGPWCVADASVGTDRMQSALDWACGTGGADCGPIQPGGSCFEPNTLEAHASYAMNSYYQKHGRDAGACNFNGAGKVVNQRPRFGNCNFPSSR